MYNLIMDSIRICFVIFLIIAGIIQWKKGSTPKWREFFFLGAVCLFNEIPNILKVIFKEYL